MKRKSFFLMFNLGMIFILLMTSVSSYSQSQIEDSQIFQTLKWRNIGPSNMMGRISALDALDEDYRVVLVGSASGGVFKSTNADHPDRLWPGLVEYSETLFEVIKITLFRKPSPISNP
jgi:hypothetical protein